MEFTSQSRYAIRFEWGLHGVKAVANRSGVAIIVDVLSFSTCVDVACSRNAEILPYRFGDAGAEAFARSNAAMLATSRADKGFSLSPESLLNLEPRTRLVLPSPNGSTLTLACTAPVVIAGCLRNASAVASYASSHPGPITLVAAGERWGDGALRPAVEDLLGAGAVIHYLSGERSPEALVAESAFLGVRGQLPSMFRSCASAVELITQGFSTDVELALDLNISNCVPRFIHNAYVQANA